MKILKWIALVLVALGAILLVGGAMLSPKFTVSRSIAIQAPASKVYGLVAEPRQWKLWSVWTRRDPGMQIDYSGPVAGTGAAWSWHSKTEGDGKMVFTSAEPARRVAFELYFIDFGTTSSGQIDFVPDSASTKVIWTMTGDMGRNPINRWMALAADAMVGKDFEAGLANLKTVAERP
jgi:uncharacterized protein YndB with AHSA1/START domain